MSTLLKILLLKWKILLYRVADNIIDRDFLKEIIESLLFEDDYSEELKLKISNLPFKTIN